MITARTTSPAMAAAKRVYGASSDQQAGGTFSASCWQVSAEVNQRPQSRVGDHSTEQVSTRQQTTPWGGIQSQNQTLRGHIPHPARSFGSEESGELLDHVAEASTLQVLETAYPALPLPARHSGQAL